MPPDDQILVHHSLFFVYVFFYYAPKNKQFINEVNYKLLYRVSMSLSG